MERPSTSFTPKLLIVGTPIGNLSDLSSRALEALKTASVILCEDTRRTAKLLAANAIEGITLLSLHQHNEAEMKSRVLKMLKEQQNVVLVSDAGMPLVSDPGSIITKAVIEEGFDLGVIPGPSAALMALVLSGFLVDRFSFEGFLPRKGTERKDRLEIISVSDRPTVIFEAPGRVKKTIEDLEGVLQKTRQVALCAELTKIHERVWRGSIGKAAEWFDSQEAKGEWAIVVDGALIEIEEASDELIIEALLKAQHAAPRSTHRDLIDRVAKELSIKRRRVYELAQQHLAK